MCAGRRPLATAVYHVGARGGKVSYPPRTTADHVNSNKSCISSSPSDFHVFLSPSSAANLVMCHVAEMAPSRQLSAAHRSPDSGTWDWDPLEQSGAPDGEVVLP